jgi:hypothetical protein
MTQAIFQFFTASMDVSYKSLTPVVVLPRWRCAAAAPRSSGEGLSWRCGLVFGQWLAGTLLASMAAAPWRRGEHGGGAGWGVPAGW